MRPHPLTLVLVLALSACASTEPTRTPEPATKPGESSPISEQKITAAATTPLNDLNVVHASIPPVLIEAQKGPYAAPADSTCSGLTAAVQALDSALGPDLDVPSTPSNPGLIERGGGVVGDAAVGALKGAAEGLVPFRSWVRKLSGAERYSKQVAAAIAAGTVRRAFLKGMGQTLGCQSPAAPKQAAKPN